MKLPIVKWPSPTLKQQSFVVNGTDRARLEQLIADMTETMMAAGGVGLSAIQVGVPLAVVVTRFQGMEVLLNPYVETHEAVTVQDLDGAKLVRAPIGKLVEFREGCLSLPGIYETTKRYNQVRVYSQTLETLSMVGSADVLVNLAAFYKTAEAMGMDQTPVLATGVAAQCVQHELEHLRGEFFLDRLSPGRRDAIRVELRRRR